MRIFTVISLGFRPRLRDPQAPEHAVVSYVSAEAVAAPDHGDRDGAMIVTHFHLGRSSQTREAVAFEQVFDEGLTPLVGLLAHPRAAPSP
jgi:hypothetical protein